MAVRLVGVGSVYVVWCVVRQVRTRVHRWQVNSNFNTASVPIIEIRDDSWSWAETKNILTGVSTRGIEDHSVVDISSSSYKKFQLRGVRLHKMCAHKV